ncbi:ATP-dependent DNA helicase [Trichonephila inaurata madagascariensis]|uniref:ATP-dependent DNA helicase n=1 Tax=Trichonephila inaurata madagascariensis TaxID=2747483 RepID=A0A8X6IF14_9ARAC|nr:ATP-dependent DNA helicase [Trichonephila inaurata madagascariensis]
MLNNDEVFGGKVEDYWWQIEFQNRGSPHLHMVVWINDHPLLDTPEGLQSANDPENYYYSLLLQYVAYHSEDELLDCFNSAQEAFQAREELLREQCDMMEIYKEQDRQLEMALNRACAFELLNQEPEPLDHDDIVEIPEENQMNENQFERASNECRTKGDIR